MVKKSPENACWHEAVQAYGRKKLDGSTFVGKKNWLRTACFYTLAVIGKQPKLCIIEVLSQTCLPDNSSIVGDCGLNN